MAGQPASDLSVSKEKAKKKANQDEINIKEPFPQALGASSFKG